MPELVVFPFSLGICLFLIIFQIHSQRLQITRDLTSSSSSSFLFSFFFLLSFIFQRTHVKLITSVRFEVMLLFLLSTCKLVRKIVFLFFLDNLVFFFSQFLVSSFFFFHSSPQLSVPLFFSRMICLAEKKAGLVTFEFNE